jgi:hypothetical protein
LITPLVPESLSLTWNPSFLCGAILVHPGPRLLVNCSPPPHSLFPPPTVPQSNYAPFYNDITTPTSLSSAHKFYPTCFSLYIKIGTFVDNSFKKTFETIQTFRESRGIFPNIVLFYIYICSILYHDDRPYLTVKGTWYFYCDWCGFGVAQYLVSETRVAVSIFDKSNITQYIFLSLV